MIHGPRTRSSPADTPSCGRRWPAASTIFISTPYIGRPCMALMAIFSAIGRSRCLPFIVPTVPTGLISVMPQPCMTVTPYFVSKVSIMAWGALEPPRLPAARLHFLQHAEPHRGHAERQADALGLE